MNITPVVKISYFRKVIVLDLLSISYIIFEADTQTHLRIGFNMTEIEFLKNPKDNTGEFEKIFQDLFTKYETILRRKEEIQGSPSGSTH